jgi:ornithine--oxo-acid transaminase
MTTTQEIIEVTERYGTHNYRPLPIVISEAEGIWVTDAEGVKYMDCLSAYSAINHGHRHPEIVSALKAQLDRVAVTSRAFHNDQLGPFTRELTELCKMEVALPMNSGAEAVETAVKAARKWAYEEKKIPKYEAEIICCSDNFHGRTLTIISFSTEPLYRDAFGPFTPGFKIVPFGDAAALEKAITPKTAAFLVEPIQGEAGVVVPPEGYLGKVAEICRKNDVLLIADEIQTGFARTGRMFACDYDGVRPDLMTVGKALGGGLLPISAVVGSRKVLGLFKPGEHGSTFGGNPLACAVGRKAMELLVRDDYPGKAEEMGQYFMERLRALDSPVVEQVRGKGLLIGVVLEQRMGGARPFCERLMKEGILAKETHDYVIRFAPPLVIQKDEIDWAMERIARVLK